MRVGRVYELNDIHDFTYNANDIIDINIFCAELKITDISHASIGLQIVISCILMGNEID